MWRGGGLSISRYTVSAVLCGGGGDQVSQNIPGGGLRGVDHEMFRDLLALVSMHILEPQS